jgi:hypothetical protein
MHKIVKKEKYIYTNAKVVLLQTGISILSQLFYSKFINIMKILWNPESAMMACHICSGINPYPANVENTVSF